jgi:hypothetical protein
VRIRDRDFKDRRASRTLPVPVSSDRAIAQVALELLAKLRAARRMPARLLSVGLTQISREPSAVQGGLFPDDDLAAFETERDRRLSQALDQLRERFGRDAVDRGR